MNLSTNIMYFQQVFGIEKTLGIFAQAGFDAIEFNTDIDEYYTDAHDKNYYKELKKLSDSLGIKIPQAHAPFRFGTDMKDAEKAKKHFHEIIKGIEHSSYLGAEMIIVHPIGHNNLELEENREQLFEYNFMYYNALLPYAEDFGVKIAIENINGSIWKSAENVAKLYDELNNSNFVVCFDVGHGNIIGEDPAEMIRTLSDRIKCTHVHDNNSTADSHTLPFYGTIDWESVMKAFAEVGYIGNLNYEAGLFVKNVPETLRPDAAKYMAKVGRHLIERYNYYRNNK